MGRTCSTNQLVVPVGDAVGAACGIEGADTVAIAGRTVGLAGRPPYGYARRRRAAHPEDAQRRDRRLGRAGLPPPRASRAQHHAAYAPTRQRRRVEALPCPRRARGGVPHHREEYAAALGRKSVAWGHPLSGVRAAAPPRHAVDPLPLDHIAGVGQAGAEEFNQERLGRVAKQRHGCAMVQSPSCR